jgi:site-specific recombinase XerD
MPQVFSGKVAIPGEKIEEYLQALEEAEQAVAPLRRLLKQLNSEFEQALLRTVSAKTAYKHASVIAVFIDFVCGNTDVRRIEEITRGMANSYFRRWYLSKVGDRSESELKTAIKYFFQFLDREKGITNEAVLKSFQTQPRHSR